MKTRGLRLTVGLAASAFVLAVSSAAFAGPKTPVLNSGEPNHQQIIQSVYGGVFAGAPSTGFARGGSDPVTLTRAEDIGGGVLSLMGSNMGLADDGMWSDGIVSIQARARFAAYSQTFGYFQGADPAAPFVPLLSVGGSGYAVTGSLGGIDLSALMSSWRWGRAGDGSVFSSRASDNPDGMDHMVSYKVEGLNNGFDATWLLCFEDLRADQTSDWDYNDLVIEVSVSRGPQIVPLPGAAAMGLAGVGLIAGVRRRRTA